MTDASHPLFSKLSTYIYGTTRLGHDDVPLEDRLKIARAAVDSGVWFHTSRQYDSALETLGTVFSEDRSKVPPLFVKMGNSSIEEIRGVIQQNMEPLGITSIDVGQLSLQGDYGQSFATGGHAIDELQALKDEGLIKHFVYEVFPWTSEIPYEALKAGHADGLIDAFIFYLNPLQRFAANKLWDLIEEKSFPVIAMRTVCGAPVHTLRDVPGAAWCPYLQERAVEVAPIFERSGIESWSEFCVRFAFSFPQVKATVGSTSRQSNLNEYLKYGLAENKEPLPDDIMADLIKLQYRWSDETDVKAEPWTM